MRYTIALIRSILFWIAFFVMSSISSIGGVIALPISHRGTVFFVRIWAKALRLFCRFLLGLSFQLLRGSFELHLLVADGMPDGLLDLAANLVGGALHAVRDVSHGDLDCTSYPEAASG